MMAEHPAVAGIEALAAMGVAGATLHLAIHPNDYGHAAAIWTRALLADAEEAAPARVLH